MFEASWAYYMKTLNSKALGNIHTLSAPYFENQFYPEAVLLRAVIYFKYCLYDQAEEAIAETEPLGLNWNVVLPLNTITADANGTAVPTLLKAAVPPGSLST